MMRTILIGVVLSLACSNSSRSAIDAGGDSALPWSAGGAGGAGGSATDGRANGAQDSGNDAPMTDDARADAFPDSPRAGADGRGTGGTSGKDGGGAGGASADSGSGDSGQDAPMTVCGNGVCEKGEIARLCPDDCAETFKDVGVDVPGALMWQLGSSTFMTWDNAKLYCQNLELDGYSDWRMPTYKEQEGILGNCAQDFNGDTYCSPCKSSPLCVAWFSKDELNMWNSYEYSSGTAGAVNFSTGAVGYSWYKTNYIRVRCVRALIACTTATTCLGNEDCISGHCVPTWFTYDAGAVDLSPRDTGAYDVGSID